MGSNEEYLDNLLKGVVKDKVSQQGTPAEEELYASDRLGYAPTTGTSTMEEKNGLPFDIDAMLSELTGEGMDLGYSSTQEEEAYKPVTVEDTQNMSEDQIEDLISNSTQNVDFEEDYDGVDTDTFAEDSDVNVQEISSLLKKSEENEAVTEDVLGFLEKAEEDKIADETPVDFFSEFVEGFELEEKNPEKSKEDKHKSRKDKKEESKSSKKNQTSEKKAGLISRLVHAMTEEAEPSEEEKALILSQENSKIIQELDAEKKKNKKSKTKKGNKKGNKADTGEDDVETKKPKKTKSKKVKPVKPPKPKKVKEPAPVEKSRKLSKKSIFIIFAFAASLFAAIFLLGTLFSDITERRNAQRAFEQKEYQAAYEYFFEAEEGTEDANRFHHARAVLRIKRRLENYEQKLMLDQKVEALHSLMQAINNYDDLYQYALNYNASNEVEEIYLQILGVLSEEYGLTEETAKMIAFCESDEEYTRYLIALVEGNPIETVGQKDNVDAFGNDVMQDVLPEEMELPNTGFTN